MAELVEQNDVNDTDDVEGDVVDFQVENNSNVSELLKLLH